ncbi:MAG: glutamate 5-kinase [Deltaproteobacteria bacterium]|nr:glutamate 5-kinase [Deltaproteobacteria bacterium]
MKAHELVARQRLVAARRVVVKVGSQALCQADGRLDSRTVAGLCQEIAALWDTGREVVLVSSGAVASGTGELGGRPSGQDLGKQALAAIGQPLLMARYRQEFAIARRHVGQVLLTHADLGDRSRFLHARRVMGELLAAGVVPIVNENDTVAVEELKFGDNDQLAAQVAHLVEAEALVLLTEVDGLYTANPHTDDDARMVTFVGPRDHAALAAAGDGKSAFGTGGMRSKVLAANKAGAVGVVTAIAAGKRQDVLRDLLAGQPVGTVFAPPAGKLQGRRSWLATSGRARGVLHLDDGAARAIASGTRSLLPAGVVRVSGQFAVGDPVDLADPAGAVLARGLVRYASDDAAKVCGLRSEQIAGVLGWLPAGELVHRDDLVVL